MAYKKQNTVDYFPHAVNHGRKMFIIRSQYGNDGFAVWFMLLEELGKAHNHFLNLTEGTQKMFLSAQFHVTQEVLMDIINTLVELGEFDKILWCEKKILFSEKFIDSIEDAYKRRVNDMITICEIRKQFQQKCQQNCEKCNQVSSSPDKIPQSKSKSKSKSKVDIKEDSKNQRFSPPSREDVYSFFLEKKMNSETANIEAEKFVNHYDSNGWQVGRTKMKKWKAAAAGWMTRMNAFHKPEEIKPKTSDHITDKFKKYD